MTPTLVILLLATACDQPLDGTAVGNPGLDGSDLDEDGVLRLGVIADADLGVDLADLALDRLELLDCDGNQRDVEVGAQLDLLDAPALTVPAGAWCQLDLRLATVDEPLLLGGLTTGGTTWRVALDPGVLTIADTLYVDGQELSFDLDLGVLFSATDMEALGQDVDIAPQDSQALAWSDTLLESVELDGVEGGDAGDAGAPAGALGEDASADGGCTCATGGLGGSWLLLAVVALWRRRR